MLQLYRNRGRDSCFRLLRRRPRRPQPLALPQIRSLRAHFQRPTEEFYAVSHFCSTPPSSFQDLSHLRWCDLLKLLEDRDEFGDGVDLPRALSDSLKGKFTRDGLERVVRLVRELSSLAEDLRVCAELEAEARGGGGTAGVEGGISEGASLSESFGEERRLLLERAADVEEELTHALFESRTETEREEEVDSRDALLEVRPGVGGEEASLFARELLDMYAAFATQKGWHVSVAELTESTNGGLKQATANVRGVGAYGCLKMETGVHRVQRVPVTDSRGRMQTSSVCVVVLPFAQEKDVPIQESDLQFEAMRSSGPGGQSVNTSETAVRATHLPSKLSVVVRESSSQIENRKKALTLIRTRLFEKQRAQEQEAKASERGKQQITLCQQLESRSTLKCLHLMSLVPLVRLGRVIHLLLCLRCPTLHTQWLRRPQVMVPLHLFPLLRTPTRLCRRGTRPPTTPSELLVQQQLPWQSFPVPSPGHSVQVVTCRSELAKKAIDQLAIFSGTPQEDVELWKESFHEVVDEVRWLDSPHALGPQDLSGIIRQKVSSGVREVLHSRTVQADQIYDPSWLLDTLDSLYLGPYESRIQKRWHAVKALYPLASESVDTYFARAAKVFGRLRRLVPAMVFGSEPFVPFEYSILLESLPTEGGAHRYVLAHLQDYTPMGLRDCLRRYEQQLGRPTPSATIWFSSAPPSRSSSTPKPNHPKCIYYGVTHPWRKHVKCIAYGASPHADRPTYPAIAHVCGCGKQGHLDAMCPSLGPSKLRASKKAANVHCATVFFASAAVISPDLVHGPHFGKDNGATVEAVGELYLEKVSTSITYTVKVLDTPVPVRTAGRNNSSEASGAVVYATHSVTLDDVIFGDRLESITFLILPQSSIPFLFSKALAQRLSVKMDYQDNVMVIPSPSGPDVTLTWIDLGEYYGLPLVQDDDSPPSLVGSDESDDECPPLEDDPNESEDEIDNSASFRPLPFAMCTTTSPTTTPALHSPPEGIAGVGVPVSTGEAPEGVRVCMSGEETPEGMCMSVSPKEASVPSGEGVEGLKEPAHPGGLAGGAFTAAQDSVKATTGGDVKGLVSFSIPGVSFTKGAYVGARLHLDSLYLGASDCGPTHQLTVLEDFLPYGLAPRFAAHSNSHETVAFLENIWFPRFGVPEEIRCDQGSEFANAPLIELSKRRGFRLSFAPSGYKDGNSLSERWQREVFASVCSLLLERQLPGSSWPEIHDEAIRRLNNRMSVQGGVLVTPPLPSLVRCLVFTVLSPLPALPARLLCGLIVWETLLCITGVPLEGGVD
uniref:Integrase catalytic domain-containing protein n=1 Tax=Chromera velia CCMP2878 TaxID=1169474 RepID=A0A0G4ID96_9ALVE|eukprot:Cvel_13332.t1-p1 / transcript=Cvel_13332.t1 / gene=Cvel_13332 / organism=Chromera_velia_CCMP2878 / gene_product=Peptide chain release factor 1, putative / transcript_product=Peptide chain release factor 1, putative / location=Cvel_scaffold905:45302-54965(-) / protein_length=1287 / sequence_SO=supercontig / SO=protein_coding / is_pseudo=false